MDERTRYRVAAFAHTPPAPASSPSRSGLVDAPYIGPRKAWGAEPVRFSMERSQPTRIALMNSLAERSISRKGFRGADRIRAAGAGAAEADQLDQRRKSARSGVQVWDNWVGQFNAWARSKTSPRAQNPWKHYADVRADGLADRGPSTTRSSSFRSR